MIVTQEILHDLFLRLHGLLLSFLHSGLFQLEMMDLLPEFPLFTNILYVNVII